MPETEADWFIARTREILLGTVSQACFADLAGIHRKGFERVLSRQHRLSRNTAVKIHEGFDKLARAEDVSTRKRHAIARIGNVLRTAVIRNQDGAVFDIARQLVVDGVLAAEAIPEALPRIAQATKRYVLRGPEPGDAAARVRELKRLRALCRQKIRNAAARAGVLEWLDDELDYPAVAKQRRGA